MLTSVLKALVYELFFETFYGKMIKELIFYQFFILSIKWFINNYSKGTP